jgi:hypothetical protein
MVDTASSLGRKARAAAMKALKCCNLDAGRSSCSTL